MAQNFLSDIKLGDNIEAQFGTTTGLYITHNPGQYANGSFISNSVGNLYIRNSAQENDIVFSQKDDTGGIVEFFRVDGGNKEILFTKKAKFSDNVQAVFGSGTDLKIFHDGTNNQIRSEGGSLDFEQHVDDGTIRFYNDDGSGGQALYFYLDGSTVRTQFNKQAYFVDSAKVTFGDGEDLQIYHNGSNSYIENETGNFYIKNKADNTDMYFQCDDGSGGLANYFYLDGSISRTIFSQDTRHNDSVKAFYGSGYDLEIYHDGSHSYIKDTGTGELRLSGNVFRVLNANASETMIYAEQDGKVQLRFNESTKFETANTGVKVFGDVMPSTDGGAKLGAGSPTNLRWAGIELSNGAGIQWTNGDARIIEGLVNNYSLSFQTYDSSTTTLSTALRLDGNNLATFAGDVTVGGNLIVNGTTTTINTATVEVEDNILQLNTTQGSPDTATAATSGISIYRGDGVTQASFIFDDSDDTWDLTNNLTVAGTLGVAGSSAVSTSALTIKSQSTSSQQSGINIVSNGGTNAIIRMGEKSTDGGRFHMFDGGTEKIAFYTDGTNNHISAGNLGIGTNAPDGVLDVHGASGRWRVNTYGAMYFRNDNDTGNEQYIHARSDGRLSIGRSATSNWSGSGNATFFATTYDHLTFATNSDATFAGDITVNGGDINLNSATGPIITLTDTDSTIGVDSIIGHIAFVGTEIGGETSRIASVSETAGGEAGLRFYTGSSVTQALQLDKDQNATFASSVNLTGVDVGGVTSPTLYIGQLTNAYQAGMQSSVHLTMKTTNGSGNFYWYRGSSSVMYYSDALYVDKVVDKGSTNYYLDPGSTSTALNIAGHANISNNVVKISTDGTYGGSYGTVAFGGISNGSNRVFGHTGTGDGLFLASATGRGIFFRVNGGSTDNISFNSDGSATFKGSVHLDSDSAQLQFGDDNDMQVYHNGANGEINIATGDFTIDSAGDITLDAAGNDIRFFKNGVEYGKFKQDSSHFDIFASVQDKDLRFKGNDGGSTVTALTLDMSDGGAAEFGNRVYIPEYIAHVGDSDTLFGFSGADTFIVNTGGSTALTIDSSQDTTFAGDVLPSADASKNLGSGALRWATLRANYGDFNQSSTTDPVLRLTDAGVANYDFIFPDTNTIKLETNTSSTKTFKLLNAGSGNFNFEASGTVTTGGDLTIGGTGGIFMPEYIYHAGDTNNYFGFPSADHFKVATSGSDALTIDSNQNAIFAAPVWIPDYIYHTGDSNTYFGFSAADTFRVITAGSQAFSIDSSQYVKAHTRLGVGIDPAVTAHVYSTAPILRLQDGGDKASNASGYIEFYDHDSHMMNIGVNDGGAGQINLTNNASFTIKTNNSVALTLSASQNATFEGTITTDRLSLFTSNTDRATIQAGSSGTTGHLYLNSYTGTTLKQLTWSAANSGFYPQGASGSFDLGLNGNRWNRVYAQEFHGDGSNLTNISSTFNGGTVTNATTFSNDITVNGGDVNVTKQNDAPTFVLTHDGTNPGTSDNLWQIASWVDYDGTHQNWGNITHRTISSSSVRTALLFDVKSQSGNVQNALMLEGQASAAPNAIFAGNIIMSGSNANLKSDQIFQFLTTNSNAQVGKFKSIQLSTSYSGTPPSQGILFGTDTNLYRDSSNVLKTDDSLIVAGDLTVQGTTVTIDTTNLNVEDKNITLNYGSGDTSSNADGAGITIQDGVNSSTDATIAWDKTNSQFTFSHGAKVNNDLLIGDQAGSASTQAFGAFDQLRFDNSHSSSNVGPNKIVMHDNGGAWIGGFGIHSDTVSYYTGGGHRFYRTTSQSASTLLFESDGNRTTFHQDIDVGNFRLVGDNSSGDEGKAYIRSNGDYLVLNAADGEHIYLNWDSANGMSGHVYVNTNIYAQAFYDRGDTTYYLDPANTGISLKAAGKVEHKGLQPTSGTNIDQIKEFTMTFQLTANTWTDTGINGTDLTTGTYAVQVYVDDYGVGGNHYTEYYSGMMSWYEYNTNNANTDELVLHRAGHAPNNGDIQLRTERVLSADTNDLMLQVKHNQSYSAALNNTTGKSMRFKFRRLI